MKLGKHQKLFFVVPPIAALITIYSHINALRVPTQSYLEFSNASLMTLVADYKQAHTPETIGRNCLPRDEATGAELVGEYRNETTTQIFQVWNLKITPSHSVLRVQGLYSNEYGTACLLAYDERYNRTIGEDLSQEDARQVALVVWQYRVSRVGGTTAAQTDFNNTAAELAQYGEIGYVSAEDKWALETIGIRIPPIYQIYDPENPPQMIDSDRGDI